MEGAEFTIEKIKWGSSSMDEAISLLKEQNKDVIDIDAHTAEAIREECGRGRGVMLAVRNPEEKIIGAAFSLFHEGGRGYPSIGMYTYEAGPDDIRKALLERSIEEIRDIQPPRANRPVFFEADFMGDGAAKESRLQAHKARGFHLIRYDNIDENPEKTVQWSDGNWQWMVHGKTPPTLKEMEAAIHLQRSFVALAMEPDKARPLLDRTLGKRLTEPMQGDDEEQGYYVNSSIQQARNMAKDGRMEFVEPMAGVGQGKRPAPSRTR